MNSTRTAPSLQAPVWRAPALQPRKDHSRAWNLWAVTVVWLSCLAVVALWVVGGGIQDLVSLSGDTLASLSRLTGLVSANLLLLQVLLMARVPLFERGFGRSEMTKAHRLVGIWSFTLLCSHIVLIVPAYAMQDGTNVLAESWDVLWNYPGVGFAALGTAALIMVMATSARRARRRLRYESWHLLHLYAYFGIGIAIPHMLLTGNDFVDHPLATGYWWAIWGVTAACLVVFRIAIPLLRSARYGLRVAEVLPDGSRGVTVRITGRKLWRLRARAGQHFVWRFLDGPGWSRGHPLSLSAAPTANELQISARIVGDGTLRLARLKPGTRVMIEGPYGHVTGAARTRPRVLMLGAGAGVAPLVSLLDELRFVPGEAVLVTRDHAAEELMAREAITRMVQDRGLVHYALTGRRAASGPAWLPAQYADWTGPEMVRHLAPEAGRSAGRGVWTDCDVFLCGPAMWMRAVRRDLLRAGIRRDRIHAEMFSID